MKEKIDEIIYEGQLNETTYSDQILDLILSEIVIEKKLGKRGGHGTCCNCDGCHNLWEDCTCQFNECIDQLEEIKNKLRE